MHVSSLARRYGRALAAAAIEGGEQARVGQELKGIAEFLEATPLVRLVLESPGTSVASRRKVVDAVTSAHEFSHYTKNLLGLLLDNLQFRLFAEIAESFRREVNKSEGVVDVEVRSAEPLNDKQQAALRSALESTIAADSKVRLDVSVDESLLAGAVTRIGSVVYDGSLVHQLDRIRQQLISE